MRRRIQGYTDLGPIRIPPLPPFIIMTDRADGALWLLSFSGTDETGHISLNDQIPTGPERRIFGPYEGPYVQERTVAQGSPVLRLLVRSGHLGYEEITGPDPGVSSIDNPTVLIRRGNENIFRIIEVPLAWQSSAQDELAWEVYTI